MGITTLFEVKNKQKQKRKIARLHKKVMNQCTDFLNKLNTEIIKNYNIIYMRDLNIKGMLRNHKLAENISTVSWSRLVPQLPYDWYGRKIGKVDK